MTNASTYLCPCGARHPLGATCRKTSPRPAGLKNSPGAPEHRSGTGPEQAARPAGNGKCAAARQQACGSGTGAVLAELADLASPPDLPDLALAAGCGCSHTHAPALAPDPAALGETTATRAVYRITNMDCPMEEALIRKKLGDLPGVSGLEFNLMQRVLTVRHQLPSTEPIETALKDIDMTPEPILPQRAASALFQIDGLDGPAGENLVQTGLAGLPGLLGLELDPGQRTLKVLHEPGALPAVSEALAALGLGARLMAAEPEADSGVAESDIPWRRLALAGVFAAFSEALELMREWGAAPFGLNLQNWKVAGFELLEFLPLFMAVIAVLLGGLGTYKKGWIAVKNRNLNINALMSVAVTGALFIGQYPEAAMVMVLFNLAEAIEAKSLDRARKAVKNLLGLTPQRATVLKAAPAGEPAWVETDIREVTLGSRVRVKPGERVALDGTVLEGHSSVNQAPITGESLPVEKTVGDMVYAGSINESGSFEFEVTALAGNSILARIIHAVEEAQGSRAPMQRFVDRFARYYTPAVFLAALLVALIPPLFIYGGAPGIWSEWVYTALVLLVIGCPCALVISTPVSIVSGLAAASKSGILIKGGMFLEQGRLLKSLALDKTGTITRGKPKLTGLTDLSLEGEDLTLGLAAGLAARSDHPVSRAIAEAAREKGLRLAEVQGFTAIPGRGVSGAIGQKDWQLGNLRLLKELGESFPALEKQIQDMESRGQTVVALVGEGGVRGLFAVADTVRESSIEAIRELRRLGVRTVMLSGDNEHTARVIARQVGVDDFQGNLLPQDKLAAVEGLAAAGPVGMVGDGINDAPALARADIGFAMGAAGTDTAIETADVALMDDDLRKIPRFIRLSRSTYAILVQNIALALGVKAIFLGLTFAGLASMWLAVFADVGTSLLVVANGLRAMRK